MAASNFSEELDFGLVFEADGGRAAGKLDVSFFSGSLCRLSTATKLAGACLASDEEDMVGGVVFKIMSGKQQVCVSACVRGDTHVQGSTIDVHVRPLCQSVAVSA